MRTDRPFWLRIAVVVSIIWAGGVAIVALTDRRGFFEEQAPVVGAIGVAVIFALCLGIPWIMSARR